MRKGVEHQLQRWKQEGDVDYGKLYPVSSDSDSSSSSEGEPGSDDEKGEDEKKLVIDETQTPPTDLQVPEKKEHKKEKLRH